MPADSCAAISAALQELDQDELGVEAVASFTLPLFMTAGAVVRAVRAMYVDTAAVWKFSCTKVLVDASSAILTSPGESAIISKSAQVV